MVQYIPLITRMEHVYGVTRPLVMKMKPDILNTAFFSTNLGHSEDKSIIISEVWHLELTSYNHSIYVQLSEEICVVLYTYQDSFNAFISSLRYMCLQREMILLYVSTLVVDWKSGYKERPLGLNTSCGFHFACILNILMGSSSFKNFGVWRQRK